MKRQDQRIGTKGSAASDPQRRRFIKAAGGVALAVPAMETLSRQGILIRAAKAQTPVNGGQMDGIGGSPSGEVGV